MECVIDQRAFDQAAAEQVSEEEKIMSYSEFSML